MRITVLLKVIVLRFFQLFFTAAAVSAVLTALNLEKVLEWKIPFLSGLYVGLALFFAVDFILMRNCYCDLRDNCLFYIINISAYFVFAAVCTSVYFLCSSEVYTWLFAITKFLRYTVQSFTTLKSAAIFHLIGIAAILPVPIGMSWILRCDDDE